MRRSGCTSTTRAADGAFARYYDPALGRFVQADTIVPAPGNPQSLNRYAYVLNNPVRYTDPSGHFVLTSLAIAGCIGFLANVGYQTYSNMRNENMSAVDAFVSVDMVEAGGAAAGAVFAAGVAVLAIAAVPIAVTGLGLSGGAAAAATIGLTGLAYSGSSVAGAAYGDVATNLAYGVLEDEKYDSQFNVSLSQYKLNARVGGVIGLLVGGSEQVASMALNNALSNNWSNPADFEMHIRPALLGQGPSATIIAEGFSSNPVLTSDDVWGTGVEIMQNERRYQAQ